MSVFLASLVRMSRAPVPDALRPVPRARFEPKADDPKPPSSPSEYERVTGATGAEAVPLWPVAWREAQDTVSDSDGVAARTAASPPPRPERRVVARLVEGRDGAAQATGPWRTAEPVPSARAAPRKRGDALERPAEDAAPSRASAPVAPQQSPGEHEPLLRGTNPVAERSTGAVRRSVARSRPGPPADSTPPPSDAPPFLPPGAERSESEPKPRRVVEVSTRRADRAPEAAPGAREGQPRQERSASEPAEPADGPVIEVTIGRIHVRAVHAPNRPDPVPAPRSAPQTLTLADYLRERAEGRR